MFEARTTGRPDKSKVRRYCRRAAMTLGMTVLLAGAGAGGWAGYLQASGNVHTVIAGQLYRSAELSGEGFRGAIAKFHIRTVINLRGANPGVPCVQDELAASAAMGARHIDLRMSATHAPTAAELQDIRTVLGEARRRS